MLCLGPIDKRKDAAHRDAGDKARLLLATRRRSGPGMRLPWSLCVEGTRSRVATFSREAEGKDPSGISSFSGLIGSMDLP
jgi:hypothetical protein